MNEPESPKQLSRAARLAIAGFALGVLTVIIIAFLTR
jgi:hypothetical protein